LAAKIAKDIKKYLVENQRYEVDQSEIE